MKKNGFFTFIFAFVPGAGQMYLGYMKRGVSLATIVALLFIAAQFLRADFFLFFLPIVWMYSFFDTFNLRAELFFETADDDAFLFPIGEDLMQQSVVFAKKHRNWVAWFFVVFGCVMIFNWVLDFIGRWFGPYINYEMNPIVFLFFRAMNELPSLMYYALILAVGLWLVRSEKPIEKIVTSEEMHTSMTDTTQEPVVEANCSVPKASDTTKSTAPSVPTVAVQPESPEVEALNLLFSGDLEQEAHDL